jgi:CHAT domain-containing protein
VIHAVYLGGLWEVNDVATPIHMSLFYNILMVAVDSPSIAEARHFATRMLYSFTTEDAIGWAETRIALWVKWEAKGDNPNSFVKNGKKKLDAMVRGWRRGREDMILDFKDPKIWVPFVLVGN